MKRYAIKEIFLTIQGEGHRAGSKALFVRFAGCNLWDGKPEHRSRGIGPCAKWCDTDFVGGSLLPIDLLLAEMGAAWPKDTNHPRWCVLTGGEPSLQIDSALVAALHADGWLIAIETNGTIENDAIADCDWVCIAPKHGTQWRNLGIANELKFVLPGAENPDDGWTKDELASAIEGWNSGVHLFVQPQDPLVSQTLIAETSLKRTADTTPEQSARLSAEYTANCRMCIEWVMANPRWRLGAQAHKFVGLR